MNNQEQQNQVSIIINGTRYDAVESFNIECFCDSCDLLRNCIIANDCENLISLKRVFKKSDKKFEV